MITASIVTYNIHHAELLLVLNTLNSSSVDKVYVVDNSSSHATETICRAFPKVQYIASENLGYGSGHNKAMERALEAGTTYHLVMNSDITFRPEDIAKCAAFMDLHPDVGALHPRMSGLDGKDQYTVRMLPTPFDLIVRRFLPGFLFRKRRDAYLLKHLDRSEVHDIHYMQGSFMFMRADTLRQTGLFDTRFFMYPEDIDLTRRIAAVSRAVYYPGVEVTHAHRAASYTNMRMLWVHITNIVRYFNKWGWLHDPERRRTNTLLKP